jgi:hypothetical protein
MHELNVAEAQDAVSSDDEREQHYGDLREGDRLLDDLEGWSPNTIAVADKNILMRGADFTPLYH